MYSVNNYNIKNNPYAKLYGLCYGVSTKAICLRRMFQNNRGNESGIIARNVRLRRKPTGQGKKRK